jgi:glucosamine--fructose-6-phosphate aminotransferase (isomerizing)
MVVVAEDGATVPSGVHHVIRVPAVDDPLMAPVVSVVPLQLLAYGLARRLGNDVDRPRNLAKTVTVE